MIDEEKNVEMADQTSQEAVQEVQEQKAAPAETGPEKSFRELREKAERAARERDEAIRYAKEVEAKYAKPQQTQEEEEFSVEDEALMEGKHFKKLAQKQKKLEKELEEYKKYASTMTDETRLRMEHPDLDKVVCEENLKLLRDMKPALARMIDSSGGSLYDKGKAAYQLLVDLGIYKEDKYEKDRELAQKNANKPKPLAALSPQQGESPLSHANAFANGLTPDLKKKLYEEMMACRNHVEY